LTTKVPIRKSLGRRTDTAASTPKARRGAKRPEDGDAHSRQQAYQCRPSARP
jgi:hypothetical protein